MIPLFMHKLGNLDFMQWNYFLLIKISWVMKYGTLCKKCPYSELFWSAFSCIWTKYGEIQSISPYSVWMQENTDQNNSEYWRFSSSGTATSKSNVYFLLYDVVLCFYIDSKITLQEIFRENGKLRKLEPSKNGNSTLG